jgi:hypothetical protein
MAKKKRASQVEAVQEPRVTSPVRLDLSAADHERLKRLAGQIGLSKSAYARMAVLERMKADETKSG